MSDVYQDQKLNALRDGDAVVTILTLQFKDGSGPKIERMLKPAILATRKEAGCIQFNFFRVDGAADRYVFFEHWKDKSALQAHFVQPYFKDVIDVFTANLVFPLAEIGKWTEYLHEVDDGA